MGTYYILKKGFASLAYLFIYLFSTAQHMWMFQCTFPLLLKLRVEGLLTS